MNPPLAQLLSGLVITLPIAAGAIAQTTTEFKNAVPAITGTSVAAAVVSAAAAVVWTASDRSGGKGGLDLYSASRSSVLSKFGNVTALTAFNTAADETMPHVSFSGLEALFVRRSGCTYSDLYRSTRASKAAAWGSPVKLGAPFNVKGALYSNPTTSDDGLKLYFAMRIG